MQEGEWVHERWSVRGTWTEVSGPWAGTTKPLKGDQSSVRATVKSIRERTVSVLIEKYHAMAVLAPVQVSLAVPPGPEAEPELSVAFRIAENVAQLPLVTDTVIPGSTIDIGGFLSRLPFEMDESEAWSAEVQEAGPVETAISLRYENVPKEVGRFFKSTFTGTLIVSSTSGRPLRLTGHNSWRISSPTRTNERSVAVEERDHEVTWTYGRE